MVRRYENIVKKIIELSKDNQIYIYEVHLHSAPPQPIPSLKNEYFEKINNIFLYKSDVELIKQSKELNIEYIWIYPKREEWSDWIQNYIKFIKDYVKDDKVKKWKIYNCEIAPGFTFFAIDSDKYGALLFGIGHIAPSSIADSGFATKWIIIEGEDDTSKNFAKYFVTIAKNLHKTLEWPK